jgi:catalase
VKVIIATDQGIRNFTNAEATTLAGTNPDYLTQDLFEAIESGNYPSWTVSFQILNATQAENYKCTLISSRCTDVVLMSCSQRS